MQFAVEKAKQKERNKIKRNKRNGKYSMDSRKNRQSGEWILTDDLLDKYYNSLEFMRKTIINLQQLSDSDKN
jgi:hypothetical protein